MNRMYAALSTLLIIAFVSFIGCSSSQESQQQEKEATDKQAQVETTAPAAEQPAGKSDTIDINKQEQAQTEQTGQTNPSTEPKISIPQATNGNYAVQIGAFKMAEKAEEIANSARTRFQVSVKTFMDKETGLTKVLVGSFNTKDEARSFRDQIAKQFTEDYKDAWVTEFPRE